MSPTHKSTLIQLLSSKPLSSLAMSAVGRGIPIFVLHRVESEPHRSHGLDPDHLRRCLRYLVDNDYQLISLQEIVDDLHTGTALPARAVAFTMDDGYLDQAEVAAPVFLEFNCPVTFFVITDMPDGDWWPWDAKIAWIVDNAHTTTFSTQIDGKTLELALSDDEGRQLARQTLRDALKTADQDQIPAFIDSLCRTLKLQLPDTPPRRFSAIDWELARRLEKQGVRFAPHSKSHRILSRLDRAASTEEIMGSWRRLNEELVDPLKVFCYPTGRECDFGEREIATLAENGFRAAVTTIPGFVESDAGNREAGLHYRLPRFALPDSFSDFVQYSTWIEYFKTRWRGES